MPAWNQLGFQDASSPVMQELVNFHDFAMVIMVFVMVSAGLVMMKMSMGSWTHGGLIEGQGLEMEWTVVPAIILIILAVQSLSILCGLGETGVGSSLLSS